MHLPRGLLLAGAGGDAIVQWERSTWLRGVIKEKMVYSNSYAKGRQRRGGERCTLCKNRCPLNALKCERGRKALQARRRGGR